MPTIGRCGPSSAHWDEIQYLGTRANDVAKSERNSSLLELLYIQKVVSLAMGPGDNGNEGRYRSEHTETAPVKEARRTNERGFNSYRL